MTNWKHPNTALFALLAHHGISDEKLEAQLCVTRRTILYWRKCEKVPSFSHRSRAAELLSEHGMDDALVLVDNLYDDIFSIERYRSIVDATPAELVTARSRLAPILLIEAGLVAPSPLAPESPSDWLILDLRECVAELHAGIWSETRPERPLLISAVSIEAGETLASILARLLAARSDEYTQRRRRRVIATGLQRLVKLADAGNGEQPRPEGTSQPELPAETIAALPSGLCLTTCGLFHTAVASRRLAPWPTAGQHAARFSFIENLPDELSLDSQAMSQDWLALANIAKILDKPWR